jgi:hypothetical protein
MALVPPPLVWFIRLCLVNFCELYPTRVFTFGLFACAVSGSYASVLHTAYDPCNVHSLKWYTIAYSLIQLLQSGVTFRITVWLIGG